MSKHGIKIDDTIYYKTELAYNHSGENKRIVMYATDPYSIDLMINNLVEYRVKAIAKEKVTNLITEKVERFLDSI